MSSVAFPEEIRRAFAQRFARQARIRLPDDAPLAQPQTVTHEGWWVSYRLDPLGAAYVLTFLAHHRMCADSLWTIDSSGALRMLETCRSFYRAGDPADRDRYTEHNRRFYDMTAELGLAADAPLALRVNADLRADQKGL